MTHDDNPHYWNGRLSMALALGVRALAEQRTAEAKHDLSRALEDFKRSPAATPELRAHLEAQKR